MIKVFGLNKAKSIKLEIRPNYKQKISKVLMHLFGEKKSENAHNNNIKKNFR